MNKKEQHIVFVLDSSGSMKPSQTDVIGGFNTYISDMKAQEERDGLTTLATLVTFADDHSVVFASKPVGEIEPLTEATYRTIGNTALIDTVYDSVSLYREKIGQGVFSSGALEDAPAVLVVIFTDGHENASRRTTWAQVQGLIDQTTELGNWTFAYVGAHPESWGQASRLHVRTGNHLDGQSMTVREMAGRVSESTMIIREAYKEFGTKSSDSFFEEEPPKVATGAGV